MVNVKEGADIVLEGRGFVARQNRDYKEGEFRRLVNVEMEEGRLVGRRNIRSAYYGTGSNLGTDGSFGAMGTYGAYTIYASETTQYAVDGTGKYVQMFDPSVILPVTGTSWRKMVGFFEYNNQAYWLMYSHVSSTNKVGISVLHTDSSVNKNPAGFSTATIISSSNPTVDWVGFVNTDPRFSRFKFNNFFIYKDRLWIVTDSRVYFSKATDPTKFATADGGGFFDLPGERINFAMAIKDTIYVLCDSAVYAFSYNLDPNNQNDAQMTIITDRVGGYHGCIFKDTAYLINNEGIFSIKNNFVDKIFNSDLDEGINDFTRQSITPFQDYLVINKTYERNTDNLPHPDVTSDTTVTESNPFPDPSFSAANSSPYYVTGSGFGYNITNNSNTQEFNVFSESTGGTLRTYIKGISLPVGTYTFSIDAKAKNLGATGLSTYYFSAEGRDSAALSGGSVVSGSVTNISQPSIYTETVNKRISFSFTVNTPGVYVRLRYGVTKGDAGAYEVTNALYSFSKGFVNSGEIATSYWDRNTVDDGIWDYIGGTNPEVNTRTSIVKLFNYYRNLYPYMPKVSNVGNKLGYNTYFLNMINGSTHVLDYHSVIKDGVFNDYIAEVFYNPDVDPVTNIGSLMLRTSDAYKEDAGVKGFGHVVYMESERNVNVSDSIVLSETLGNVYETKDIKPNYIVEVDNFTPDGTEYFTKKYRNLLLMGMLPSSEFGVQFCFDNNAWGSIIPLADELTTSAELRPHMPHRVGINQRSKAIGIRLCSTNVTRLAEGFEPNLYGFLEISHMGLLWLNTSRGPKYAGYRSNT